MEILEGFQDLHRRKPLQSPEATTTDPKKKSILVDKPVDVDQHKRMIRRFMKLHKEFKKVREQRSIETVNMTKKEQE
jgi:hypothetical protein